MEFLFGYIVDSVSEHLYFHRRRIQMHGNWYLLHHAEENFQGAMKAASVVPLPFWFCVSLCGCLQLTAGSCVQQCSLQSIYITAGCILQVFEIIFSPLQGWHSANSWKPLFHSTQIPIRCVCCSVFECIWIYISLAPRPAVSSTSCMRKAWHQNR